MIQSHALEPIYQSTMKEDWNLSARSNSWIIRLQISRGGEKDAGWNFPILLYYFVCIIDVNSEQRFIPLEV